MDTEPPSPVRTEDGSTADSVDKSRLELARSESACRRSITANANAEPGSDCARVAAGPSSVPSARTEPTRDGCLTDAGTTREQLRTNDGSLATASELVDAVETNSAQNEHRLARTVPPPHQPMVAPSSTYDRDKERSQRQPL